MAAGVGSRFGAHTQTKPKGFVCVGGISMIERSIIALLHAGIERIIIGTGYQSSYYEELANAYPQIVCCKSDKYAETNSMYTLYNCHDVIGDDDFLLLESDLVYERKALSALMDNDYPDVMLVASFTKEQDGYYIYADDEGFLSGCTTDVGKRDACKGELVGIHKLSNSTYQKMYDWYHPIWQEQPKLGYEYAMVQTSKQIKKIFVHREEPLFWYEIDDEADLSYAEKNVIPYIDGIK